MKTDGELEQSNQQTQNGLINNIINDMILPGFLSDSSIRKLLDKDIVICNYAEDNLTDIGYNLTPTDFIFSINSNLLVEIKLSKSEKYCYIEPHDTVLIITRESIWVSESIAGTFHSKVKMVSKGFGHVSTTLDPFWEGPLLISINNPTNKRLKFVIQEDKKDGRGLQYRSFVTLVFYKMADKCMKKHDNPSGRLDILKTIIEESRLKNDKFNELKEVISNIAKLDFLDNNIPELRNFQTRKEGIKIFKEKGNEFDRKINDYINQAKSLTKDISQRNKLKNKVINVFGALLFLCPIIVMVFLAFKNKDSNSVTLGQLLTIMLSTYISVIFPYLKHKFNKE